MTTDPLRARLTALIQEMHERILPPEVESDTEYWADRLAALLREPPIGLSENVMVGPREPPAAAPVVEGTWPEHCEQRAFVQGAKWWAFENTGATMWPSDRHKAEVEALKRYGEPPAAAPLEAEAKLRALRSFCRECRRLDAADVRTPALAECIRCGELDCPQHEPLHYHHDGCPACCGTVDAARAAAPEGT